MIASLVWLARHGRLVLILGLAAGLALPGLARLLAPWIGEFIMALLLVSGARVGARAAFGAVSELRPILVRILMFQTLLPVSAALLFLALGMMSVPLALAVVLMLSAPSLTGAPNFAVMMGADPAPGMSLLVLGTALFPLTALPVLLLVDPGGGGAVQAIWLAGGLLVAILVSVTAGFLWRRTVPALGERPAREALDGMAALLLGIVVVGLMHEIGPLLRRDPVALAGWIATALAINFGLVSATLWVSARAGLGLTWPTAILAGNRNIALFLIVLPPDVAAPLMIFVGCYQIPMYLTPIVLPRLSRVVAPQHR